MQGAVEICPTGAGGEMTFAAIWIALYVAHMVADHPTSVKRLFKEVGL